MSTLTASDEKQAQLLTTLGLTGSVSIDDLEWQFYSANSGLTPAARYSITDHKLAYYKLYNVTGASLVEVEKAFFALMGAQGSDYDSLALDFYTNYGFGPRSISHLAAWFDASNVNAIEIAKDTFDRSKNLANAYNPAFEDGTTTGWSTVGPVTIANSTAQAHSGAHSMLATWGVNASSDSAAPYILIPCLPSTQYTASIWVQIPASMPAVRLRIANPGVAVLYDSPIIGITGSWIRLTGTFTTAVGQTNIQVQINNGAATANGNTVYIDDLQIELGSQATPFTWGDTTHLGSSNSGHYWTGADGITSQQATASTGSVNSFDVKVFAVDVSAVMSILPISTNYTGIIAGSTDANNFYLADCNGQGQVRLLKQVASVFTVLGTTANGAIKAGDTLELALGTASQTVKVNGVSVLTGTDTALTTGTRVGYRSDVDATVRLRNFSVKTPIYSDGATLPIWPDISGNYHHATQPNSAQQPAWQSNKTPSGKPALVFDGTDDGLPLDNFSPFDITGGHSIFVVGYDSAVGGGVVKDYIAMSDGANVEHILINSTNNWGTWSSTGAVAYGPEPTGVHLLEVVRRSSTDVDLAQDGTVSTKVTSGYDGSTVSEISRQVVAQQINGGIAAIIIFEKALSTNERQRMERYLKARFGTP